MDGTEELRIAGAVARRWARLYGLDVDEATGVAVAAIVEARPSWDPARGPWAPFAAVRGRSGLAATRRRQRAAKRGAPGALESDPESPPAGPDRFLARDELAALIADRGATVLQADTLARWLTGETDAVGAARRGVSETAIRNSRLTAVHRIGMTREEARALLGLARGERLADIAWGGVKPVRDHSRYAESNRRTRRRHVRTQPVDASTVCLRQQRALAKLRGVA